MPDLGPESELSTISSFMVAAAEALIDLYQGHTGIACNSNVYHPVLQPQNLHGHRVVIEDIEDIDRKLF